MDELSYLSFPKKNVTLNFMLTSDDLKKLRGVIREEVGSSETKLRGVIHKEITGLETKMEHRFNAVDKRFENLEKQMKQDRLDWSTFFNEAGIFFDEMRNQLTKRIKKLEDNERISKN
jgi:hypothetical protein